MSHQESASESSHLRLAEVVDDLTVELSKAYPSVEPADVHDIVCHAALELGFTGNLNLRGLIHRRANARLGAVTGQLTAIRRGGATTEHKAS